MESGGSVMKSEEFFGMARSDLEILGLGYDGDMNDGLDNGNDGDMNGWSRHWYRWGYELGSTPVTMGYELGHRQQGTELDQPGTDYHHPHRHYRDRKSVV